VRFSVSHSADLALIAFTSDRELGVDLERARDFLPDDFDRWFSSDEARELRSLTVGEQQAAFFRCWTRKEAYVKARGSGLSFELKRFSMTVDSKLPPALLWVDGEPDEPSRWEIRDLALPFGYCGALAVERPVNRVYYWDIEQPR
jgi:4'-phosphopantetheinyl transferase